jgi:hypothetical protein
MQFDLARTMALIRGGLLDRERTWEAWLANDPPWQQTTTLLTGPLIVASTLLSLIFASVTGGWTMYSQAGMTFIVAAVLGVLMAAVSVLILSAVFYYLAGPFGARRNFDRTFAGVSLGLIPSYVAAPLAALIPRIGGLVAFAGFVVALVFLYRLMPLALGIPEDKRVAHYFASLAVALVVNFMVAGFVASIFIGDSLRPGAFWQGAVEQDEPTAGGWAGEMERQARIVAAAREDRYEPPANGMLTDAQVVAVLDVLGRTRDAQARYARRMQQLARERKDQAPASLSGMGRVVAGMTGAAGVHTVEMEVVMSGGGNWAEHQWVKEQLRAALLHQGTGTPAMEHNYRLFRAHEAELMESL